MARTTARMTYLSPAAVGPLRSLVGLAGLVGVIAGPLYAVNGATQARAAVEVPAELARAGVASVPGLPDGVRVTAVEVGSQVQLSAWHSTVAEQLLARGDVAVLGVALGVGAWLLRPVLAALAAGHPATAGNARRVARLAVVVVVAGMVGPLLPQLGALAVLDRLDLDAPGGPFTVGVHLSLLTPLLAGLLLLVLAEVLRQGARSPRDPVPSAP